MRGLALLLAFAGLLPPLQAVRAEPVEAPSSLADGQRPDDPSTSSGRTVVGTSAQTARETPDAVLRRYHLAGEVLVARGDRILLHRAYGTIAPAGGPAHRVGERWRLASITKQVTAVRTVRQLGTVAALDRPLTLGLTARQLLTHHTGLADPDATAHGDGEVPAFYRAVAPDLGYCRSRPARPGADFHYNNCDYLVLANALHLTQRWPAGMRMAHVGERGIPGFVAERPEPAINLATFGAAGGLLGTLDAVRAFDRTLLGTGLLSPDQRTALWTAEGGRSYQALGQWVFPGQLRGCAAPKRIVQRDGEIGGIQARNFILPDDDLVVIVFTNRSSDDFPIGEVWQRSGFAYDLLSAVACSG